MSPGAESLCRPTRSCELTKSGEEQIGCVCVGGCAGGGWLGMITNKTIMKSEEQTRQ